MTDSAVLNCDVLEGLRLLERRGDKVSLIVTSPPYSQRESLEAYEADLDWLDRVWEASARAMEPDGKLIINTAIMPVPQKVMPAEVRVPLNIPADIYSRIKAAGQLEFMEEFFWLKQTSKLMQWPRSPGNVLACNTVESMYVYRKPGHRVVPKEIREANEFSTELRNDLIQQPWWLHPERNAHPAPFPLLLPARFIRMYSYPGDVVLDPFSGSGSTLVAAVRMGRRAIGIDSNADYVAMSKARLAKETAPLTDADLRIGTHWRPRDPNTPPGTKAKSREQLESQHERLRYGRYHHDPQ